MKYTAIALLSLSFITSATLANPVSNTSPPTASKETSKINLNKATVAELSHSLKGIGAKRAEAIVQYREQHGHFQSLTDLASVHGFGERFVKLHWSELQNLFTY